MFAWGHLSSSGEQRPIILNPFRKSVNTINLLVLLSANQWLSGDGDYDINMGCDFLIDIWAIIITWSVRDDEIRIGKFDGVKYSKLSQSN